MSAGSLLGGGLVLGLGAAVPIGPVNILIARRTLRAGWRDGVALGAGAVSVDVSYAILYALGLSRIAEIRWIYVILAFSGVAMLAWMGFASLGAARLAWKHDPIAEANAHRTRAAAGAYLAGLLVTATNPMTLAFWFTVLPALAGRLTDSPQRDLPIICLGVLCGAMGWVLTFTSLLSLAGRFRRHWWMTAADEFGGVMLLGLSMVALLRALSGIQ